MKRPDEVRRELVAQWVGRAEDDYRAASDMHSEGRPYRWIICYHAQQAAEKYIKAYLVSRGVEPPKVHDLADLNRTLTPLDPELAEALREVAPLSAYAVDARYPGEAPEPTPEETAEALRLASRARQEVLSALREGDR